MKIVVFTGSRNWKNGQLISRALDAESPDVVITGDCRGADRLAEGWCERTGTRLLKAPAFFDANGLGDGPKRSYFMLTVAHGLASMYEPGEARILCLAAPLKPPPGKKGGTQRTIGAAKLLGVPVTLVQGSYRP